MLLSFVTSDLSSIFGNRLPRTAWASGRISTSNCVNARRRTILSPNRRSQQRDRQHSGISPSLSRKGPHRRYIPELCRHGVSNHLLQCSSFVTAVESEPIREPLKTRCLMRRESPRKVRVDEPSLAGGAESRGNRRGCLRASHAPIDGFVGMNPESMAVRPLFIGKVVQVMREQISHPTLVLRRGPC